MFQKLLPRFLFSALLFSFAAQSIAQEPVEIPLWPKGAPGSEGKTGTEEVRKSASGERSVWNIHQPSISVRKKGAEKTRVSAR